MFLHRRDRLHAHDGSQCQRHETRDVVRATTSTRDAKRQLNLDLQSHSCSGRRRGLTQSINVSNFSALMTRTRPTVNILYEELICARDQRSPDPPRMTLLDVRALRSCSEPQCVRVTTSGGSQSLCILSTYPYHGYGVAGPVTGAPPGLWGDIENECLLG